MMAATVILLMAGIVGPAYIELLTTSCCSQGRGDLQVMLVVGVYRRVDDRAGEDM